MSVGTESSEFTLTRRRPIKSSPSTNSPNRVNEPRGKSKEPHGRAPSASTRLQFNWYTMFGVLVVCRSVFALLNLVWDCDETYNYWEPMHMLAYQSGAQTWEYSPAYALRSYFYLMINLAPIYPLVYMKHLIPHSKIVLFYAWRIVFGAIIPAVLETNLFLALKQKVSRPVALFYIGLSLTSVGMWTSLSSFLPSSFCILCVIYSYTNWINGKLDRAVVGMGVAGLIGWPFALLLGLPILIDYAFLSSRGGLIKLIRCLAIYGTTIVAVLLSTDSFFFGRWVLAPLNIVLYNVFSSAGPDLYGVEPFSYYIKNLLLNLNLVLPLALLYVFVVAASLFKSVHIPRQLHLGFFGSLSLWLLVIGTRPHKEERFMYPVYPLFLIYAAVALDFLKEKLIKPILCHSRVASSLVVNAILAIHFLISLSRFLALYYNYSAQISVFAALNQPANKIGASVHLWHAHNTDKGFKTIHVCMGKEWYRFPSSFWLPADHEEQPGQIFRLKFVPSEFGAQLPGEYREDFGNVITATRYIDPFFNDLNRKVEMRIMPPNQVYKCHFHIDTDNLSDQEFTKKFAARASDTKWKWTTLAQYKFIDLASSQNNNIYKSFYLPFKYDENVKFTWFKLRGRQLGM